MVGLKALEALRAQKKKAVVVLVSNLSNRYFSEDIDLKSDKISSVSDDNYNKALLETMSTGNLSETFDDIKDFCVNAHGDLLDRSMWWLEGLLCDSYDIKTDILDYKAVYGTGSNSRIQTRIKNELKFEDK